MSRCDLDLCPLDLELLQHFECHVFKLCIGLQNLSQIEQFAAELLTIQHIFAVQF